jgi:HD-GYP domain-containing protein (c-di-GMP phosphodiesterase class II)
MELISSKNVMNIIRKTLNLIDPRLIEHGGRVAYMLYKMLEEEGEYEHEEILTFAMVGFFHDIGAYKIDEIDKMVDFETKTPINHSIYGYLFYKYLTPLDEIAKIILYHHLEFDKLKKQKFKYEKVTSYLNFVDSIDLISNIAKKGEKLPELLRNENGKYSNDAIELFLRIDEKYHVLNKLKDLTYKDELDEVVEDSKFTLEQKEMYLRMLIYSIDFRSEYTVMHTITTISAADEIGALMGLNELEKKQLHFAALFHDIGKISTPVSILEAKRKLTEDEMEIMRNHVVMSEYILKDFLDPVVLEIAIRHHEKIDGTGYPKKLKGEELTTPQRVLAVADIVSALAGKRSYKEVFSKEKIISILWNNMENRKLCDKVVKCTIANFDLIIENITKNTSEQLEVYGRLNQMFDEIYDEYVELH